MRDGGTSAHTTNPANRFPIAYGTKQTKAPYLHALCLDSTLSRVPPNELLPLELPHSPPLPLSKPRTKNIFCPVAKHIVTFSTQPPRPPLHSTPLSRSPLFHRTAAAVHPRLYPPHVGFEHQERALHEEGEEKKEERKNKGNEERERKKKKKLEKRKGKQKRERKTRQKPSNYCSFVLPSPVSLRNKTPLRYRRASSPSSLNVCSPPRTSYNTSRYPVADLLPVD